MFTKALVKNRGGAGVQVHKALKNKGRGEIPTRYMKISVPKITIGQSSGLDTRWLINCVAGTHACSQNDASTNWELVKPDRRGSRPIDEWTEG